MSELADNLRKEFHDKEYRHVYANEFLNSSIATQIKVLREQQEWSQGKLAEKTNMKQSRISVLENVHYSSWSIATLKRLAEAFDVTLRVSFESFGSRLVDIDRFGRESLERFSFDEDPAFVETPAEQLQVSQAVRDSFKRDLMKNENIVSMDAYRARKNGILQQIPTQQPAPQSGGWVATAGAR